MLLYKDKDEAFPRSVEIGGDAYDINADFRNILGIFAVLKDAAGSDGGFERIETVAGLFLGVSPCPAGHPPSAEGGLGIERWNAELFIRAFTGFVNPEEPEKDNGYDVDNGYDGERGDGGDDGDGDGPQFCYDFDAEEIYAGFLSEYGVDLFDVEYMHWYKFKALLRNLSGDSAFKKKIELRFMDLSHYKGKALADMARSKAAVRLPEVYTPEELRELEEFDSVWGNAGL